MNGGEDDLDIADEDVIIETDGRIPSVVFSQKMQEQLIRPWKNTVIVKLLGRSIGYRSLCNKLESLWRAERGFTVIDLENYYYLVSFGAEEDGEFVLTQGPWTIFGHYLTVQKWSPTFDCLSDKIETIVAWIRLPGMPLHYYHKRVLRILGEVVGRVIRIAYNTLAAKRGKFARVAVEICLNKPLVSQFQLNGKIQRIEYEGLPTICFEYGKDGHTVDTCQRKKEVSIGHGCDGGPQLEGEATGVTVDPSTFDNPNNSLFGPWMIVTKKGRHGRLRKVRFKEIIIEPRMVMLDMDLIFHSSILKIWIMIEKSLKGFLAIMILRSAWHCKMRTKIATSPCNLTIDIPHVNRITCQTVATLRILTARAWSSYIPALPMQTMQTKPSSYHQPWKTNTRVFEIFGNQVIPSAAQVLTLIK
ncbi:hypothetical protein AB3S75_012583 [Citrus x aurantiifolia]